jgi:hypothetical protein
VRIGREDWYTLQPEDVAWVTEWQLACAFRWIPIGPECVVSAEPVPDSSQRTWRVGIRLGGELVSVGLPLRDLARLITWCHGVRDLQALLHPPVWVRASMFAVQRVLARRLTGLDPLLRMGYAGSQPSGLDRGNPGR